MKKLVGGICIVVGTMTFLIGTIGIALPILPTVPFYFLTAVLYAKGSRRFHAWFLSTKLYQKHMEEVIRKKEMTRNKKVKLLVILFFVFLMGFILSPIWHAKVLVAVIAIVHFYYFLVKIKTVTKEGEYVS